MTPLRKFPRTGTWEVGLVALPEIRIHDRVVLGVLVVVERAGPIRNITPIMDRAEIAGAVKDAVRAPVSDTEPARPRTLVCTPELRFALNGVAKSLGAKLEVAEVLPRMEEAMERLADLLPVGPALVPEDPTPWRAVMADLLRERPWETLPDSVLFRFRPHESLEDAVAVVVGLLGEQLGIAIYHDEEEYRLFLEQAVSGEMDSERFSVWCAFLTPVERLPEVQVEAVRGLGLVQEGLALQLYAVRGAEMRRLDLLEERTVLAAVQGILGAWRGHGAALTFRGTTTPVSTVLGELEVRSTPDPEELDHPDFSEPLILEVPHQVILHGVLMDGENLPAITIKMAKRDALRLARLLDETYEVDALSIEEIGDYVDIRAWEGDNPIGLLARLPHPHPLLKQWSQTGRGGLFISAGGAKRRSLRPQDVVLALHVDLYDPEKKDKPIFEEGILEGASWEGPATSWPKASTVLLDFARPMRLDELPADVAEQGLEIAALIWSSVVLADHGGEPETLEATRTKLLEPGMAPLVEMLIERKRLLYPQDHRIMYVERVTRSKGLMDVKVVWSEVGKR